MIKITKRNTRKKLAIGLLGYLTNKQLSKSGEDLLSDLLDVPQEYKYLPMVYYRSTKQRPRNGPLQELLELKYLKKDELGNYRIDDRILNIWDNLGNGKATVLIELVVETKETQKAMEDVEKIRESDNNG